MTFIDENTDLEALLSPFTKPDPKQTIAYWQGWDSANPHLRGDARVNPYTEGSEDFDNWEVGNKARRRILAKG